ncbi:MAG: sulfotransferase [Litorilinea sp.]
MRNLLNKLLGRGSDPHTPVIVVSGLPRSGTSMMMKMLEAGGLAVLSDFQRTADADNPEGYYEFERVKGLDKGDTAWVKDAHGKVVKVISALLEHLPQGHAYRVIFMHRRIDEVLASQQKMIQRRGQANPKVGDTEMQEIFGKHVAKTTSWLEQQPNFAVLDINYNELLLDPEPHIATIVQFLDRPLDRAAMAAVVNPELYRNRAQA